MNSVLIMSRRNVETIALGSNPIVSITDPRCGQANIRGNTGPILRVQFNDYITIDHLPREPIRQIFNFLEQNKKAVQIIVHCEAGISRSAGVALFCAENYGAEVDLRWKSPNLALVQILREIRSEHERKYQSEERE